MGFSAGLCLHYSMRLGPHPQALSRGDSRRGRAAGAIIPRQKRTVAGEATKPMKRVVLLVALLAAGSVSVALSASHQAAAGQPAPKVLEAEKLKDNLWVLKHPDSGGNTAVFVTATGVVVVDTKNPGWGQPILDKIRELTDKPVTTIINTHTHGDHVSGNVEFPATVERRHAQEHQGQHGEDDFAGRPPAKPTPTIFETNGGRGLPKRTFEDKMTIGRGERPDRSPVLRPRPYQR